MSITLSTANFTNNRNAEWRSSPLPPVRINFERARSVPNVHEYSGNVSYNDARSMSYSDIYSYQRSQSFQDCGIFVNVSIPDIMQQFGDYSDSDFYDRLQQQQPVVPQQERPVQSKKIGKVKQLSNGSYKFSNSFNK
uniref:Uncharacterized protein LOC113790921 n=1 Tax=Dermatophagoides pteronyssinus TaxID=6956 RepID=A0A6P6XUC0_DERPT|nr:uncharacterized protein LOC113790921 [Dermatophagoides pteronyssinus]